MCNRLLTNTGFVKFVSFAAKKYQLHWSCMKPTVIYLIGTAYSGSTILGAIFGGHPLVEDVGEVAFWTLKTTDLSTRTCSCGQPVTECEFWSVVRHKWFQKADIQDMSEYRKLQLKFERNDVAQFVWRLKNLAQNREFQEYARLTRTLMETIAEVSGKPYIFDTSKSAGRGLALSKIDGLNVAYIHLIRNGYAFIVSSTKRKFKQWQLHGHSRASFVFRFSLKWLFTNLAAEFVARSTKLPTAKILYEQLMSAPEKTLMQAGDALGLDLRQTADQVAAGALIDFHHCVDGSKIRSGGPTALRLSSDAEKPIPAQIKWIFTLTAGWLAKRYGY